MGAGRASRSTCTGSSSSRARRYGCCWGRPTATPRRSRNPDRFDIDWADPRHLAFGKGLHFCVGAALGRLEGQVVVPAVLRRFPHLALADPEPTWRPTFVTRQLATLPLTTHR